MKVLVTGVKGQLGYDVVKQLESRNIECKGVDINDFDLCDEVAVNNYIKNYMPDVVIHCAAYTAVDKAEDNKELCYNVNVIGTKNIATVCKEISAEMVYISTDYVFDGKGEVAFEADSVPNPINYYGQSKYEGELAVKEFLEKYYIIRISWVFGMNGNNFVKTMLKLGKEREKLSVVSDQIGSPTYTADLAVLICDMIVSKKYGVFHATNEGYCSWHEFAVEIFKQAGLNVEVLPIATIDYPTRAERPKNSRMSKDSLDSSGFSRLPDWKDALARYIADIDFI